MQVKTTRLIRAIAGSAASFALLSAPMAQAAPADDVANLLQNYYQQAGGAKTLNDVYAAYKFAQPYVAVSVNPDGTPNWAESPINDISAQQVLSTVLKGASTRCGADRQQTTNAEIADFTKVLGSKFNAQQYASAKANFCQMVQVAAQLKMRYDAYQAVKQNGIKLAGRSASEKLHFAQHTRTVGVGFTLMYYPDLMDTVSNGLSVEDRFQYNSWLKWSDDNPTNLNIIKRIRESQGDNEDMICFSVIPNWGKLCVRINSVSSSSMNMSAWAKVHRYDKSRTVSLGSFNVPAPFGYLDELAQMKDNAKQELISRVMTQLATYINLNSQMLKALELAVSVAGK